MNRRRLLIGLVAAVILAVLASTFVYRQIRQTGPTVQPQQVPATKIVVAASPLPLGTPLNAHDLKLVPWPGNAPVPGMFTRVQDVTGRALITNVVQNEPILESELAPREAGAGLPATIPEGMRAVSVAVNQVIGVSGFVAPGTMVDVIAVGSPGGSGGGEELSKTVLEDVKVLAAGEQVQQDAQGKPHTVPVVTLLVSPENADKLALAAAQARIQLALRNTIDTKIVHPPSVLQAELMAPTGGPAPRRRPTGRIERRRRVAPPAPPAPYVVEVINGSQRETKTFPNH